MAFLEQNYAHSYKSIEIPIDEYLRGENASSRANNSIYINILPQFEGLIQLEFIRHYLDRIRYIILDILSLLSRTFESNQ